MSEWSEKISSSNSNMTITDPDYLPYESNYSNYAAYCNEAAMPVNYATPMPEIRGRVITDNADFEQYAYEAQKGKNIANLEADLEKEKMRENTAMTHDFSEYGYVRGKMFADNSGAFHTLAYGRIVNIQSWLIGEKEYVSLQVEDTTPGVRDRKAEWIPPFDVAKLKDDKYVEQLMSRYFRPSDSRAYSTMSIKDFRSRIYGMVQKEKHITLPTKAGWYRCGDKASYFDGSEYPLGCHICGVLRKVRSKSGISLEDVLSGICNELKVLEKRGSRLSFLIGYGMITWFAELCFLKWNKRPGIMILGKEDVCRQYADACLKMYIRTDGSDIIELAGATSKTLAEYVDVIQDDVFVLNCHNSSRNTNLLKAIVAGRSVGNRRINAPIVTLQAIPDKSLDFEDYVVVDLHNYDVSERFCFYMQELKARLLGIFETKHKEVCENPESEFATYEGAAERVFYYIKECLISENVGRDVINDFFSHLEKEKNIKQSFCGDTEESLIHLLQQRLELLIEKGKVAIRGDIVKGASCDLKRSLIVKSNSVYVPVKYLEEVLLSELHLSSSDFHRIRNALIKKGLLDTYDTEKNNYTKRITVSKGERIYAYEFSRSLLIPLRN